MTSYANSYDCGFIPLVGGYRSASLGGGSQPKNSYFVSSSWVGAKFPLCANLANVDLCKFNEYTIGVKSHFLGSCLTRLMFGPYLQPRFG